MSVSHSPFTKFSTAVMEADSNLFYIANKLPKSGMSSFDVDSEGNFTVVYERASTGSASHTDDLWKDTLKDVSVKVDAVVKGKIIPGTSSEPGRITFESGITATKHNKWMPNVNISLSSVQAVADSTNILVTGSWGPFSKEALVSQSTINFTQLDWKA